jgi:hypothetical protein
MTKLFVAATALVVLSAPLPANGFTRSYADGGNPAPCLYWDTRQVPYTINDQGSASAGESSFAAVQASFDPWSAPSCTDIQFAYQGTTTSHEVGYDQVNSSDNQNLVVWREVVCNPGLVPSDDPCHSASTSDDPADSCANKYNCWNNAREAIALTTTTFILATGRILDSDIELNGAGFIFTTVDDPVCPDGGIPDPPNSCVSTDIQNTLTHEVGHVLGLDHSSDSSATMFNTAKTGETSKRTLAEDDVNGVCAIYPEGQPVVTCASDNPDDPDGGCGCGSFGSAEAPLLSLLPLALASFHRRKGHKILIRS